MISQQSGLTNFSGEIWKLIWRNFAGQGKLS